MIQHQNQPTHAYVMASWIVLIVGAVGFLSGLWNGDLSTEERGFYFTVLAFGLFAAVSLQKSVRDRIEGIPVSDIYYGISWAGLILAVALLAFGLFNADNISSSEKGFFVMAYVLCMFAAITVQKNTRDQLRDAGGKQEPTHSSASHSSFIE
ncbi:MAG: inner membrane protein YiaA [Planctomycetota bacterium]|nr:inner membrane protein YiaA [Planctomycetota bacterium]